MNLNLYDRSNLSKTLKPSAFLFNLPSKTELPLISLTFQTNSSYKKLDLSSTKNQVTQNSPDNSQYNIKSIFPTRPVTSNLSGLTLQENEKFQIISKSVISRSAPRLKNFDYEAPKLPSDQDFEKILSKLELVASNKNTGHRRLLLMESDPCQVLLEKGTVQYFTIRCTNKKPPLLINIHKKRGQVSAYLSRIVPEPNRSNSDYTFSKESYYVNDIGIKFKNENFYLAVEATTDCECTIVIGFGRKPPRKKLSLKFEGFIEDDDSLFQLSNRFKKPEEIKDFISINKSSIKIKSALTTRNSNWEKRREMVISKKMENIQMKKQKVIYTIHKHELKREAERIRREEMERLVLIQRQQKFWIGIIYFFKGIEKVKTVVNSGRVEKLAKIRKSFQVKRIQRLYRDSLGMSSDMVNLSRASCLLKLFLYSSKPVFSLQLTSCIRESSNNFVLPKAFSRLIKKFNLMKELWRDHMKRMKTGMEALIRQWNAVIEEQMLRTTKSNSKHKKSQDLSMLKSIPAFRRTQILTEHILECKKTFLKSMIEYKETKRSLLESVINKFRNLQEYKKLNYSRAPPRRTSNNQSIKSDYPTLNIIPTNAYMLKLIQKSLTK